MRLTTEQLDQLEAALEAMTPPPWGCYDAYGPASDGLMRCRFVGANDRPVIGNDFDISGRREDFEGLCYVVNQARALLAAARENERLRDACARGLGYVEATLVAFGRSDLDCPTRDVLRAALADREAQQ